MSDQPKPTKKQKKLIYFGGSMAIIIPARIIREHKWDDTTVLEIESTADGFTVRPAKI